MSGQSIEGVTVNERLFHFGLTEQFDAAATTRDTAAMARVLVDARFSDEQAAQTAQTVAANPAYYGY